MNPTLTLTHCLRGDFSSARIWYEGEKPGLGNDFAAAFYDSLDRIDRAPTAHPRFGGRFRKCKLKGFPYAVYFHVGEAEVFAVALIHRRRSPEFVAEQLLRP